MLIALLGGLLIGVSLGLLGSGGSILTVPVLVYGLGHGERVAIAESLFIVGAIALLGSVSYIRIQQVSWKTVFLFGIPGMVGTYGGATAARYISATTQLLIFGVVMLTAAVFMFRPSAAPKESQTGSTVTARSVLLLLVQGMAVGAMTGLVGVGGGFLIVPALVLLRRLPIHYAVGTSLLIIALNSSSGFVKYLDTLRLERLAVDWVTIGVFIVLGAMGTVLGSRIGNRLDPRVLRRVFAMFLVVMSLLIIFREGRTLLSDTSMDRRGNVEAYSWAGWNRAQTAPAGSWMTQ
jgi:uncharacterized membrane protein YfcA